MTGPNVAAAMLQNVAFQTSSDLVENSVALTSEIYQPLVFIIVSGRLQSLELDIRTI